MGKQELSNRDNWQTTSQSKADKAEQDLFTVFENYFKGTCYELLTKPTHLKDIYGKVQLSEDESKQIYNPDINIEKQKWGVVPDFAIKNNETGKILFGEIKRQDGWVENKKPSAGRGNAHERLCKIFTPGLSKAYKQASNIQEDILPVWVVFQGNITRDPKRVREITCWFGDYKENYFMWRPEMTGKDLTDFFDNHLRKYLE